MTKSTMPIFFQFPTMEVFSFFYCRVYMYMHYLLQTKPKWRIGFKKPHICTYFLNINFFYIYMYLYNIISICIYLKWHANKLKYVIFGVHLTSKVNLTVCLFNRECRLSCNLITKAYVDSMVVGRQLEITVGTHVCPWGLEKAPKYR